MSAKRNKTTIQALLTLLQDDDIKVASLAMEQFLELGEVTDQMIGELQEAQDPQLRSRIHQLSTILARRRARQEFIGNIKNEGFGLWQGVLQINALYDSQFNLTMVEQTMTDLAAAIKKHAVSSPAIAAFMREQEFWVPEEASLDVDLYLIEPVLETKYGSPALLCALGTQLGQLSDWSFTVVLYEGRFCLIDRDNMLLDPSNGWHISKMEASEKIHPCAPRDVWMGILSQLFLVALLEGQLRDLYHFGDLLAALNDSSTDTLPFPLGSAEL